MCQNNYEIYELLRAEPSYIDEEYRGFRQSQPLLATLFSPDFRLG